MILLLSKIINNLMYKFQFFSYDIIAILFSLYSLKYYLSYNLIDLQMNSLFFLMDPKENN